MNARNLIATSVLALSATVPAIAFANSPTNHGYATDHVAQYSQRDQATRQEVQRNYQQAVQAGTFNPVAGDETVIATESKSTVSRAEVLSKINGVDLTEGDAS